ncbi:hypothetical protein NQ314_001119 [Rhamnusium bicolor]|uniref:Chitin-binding type-2 domain-containing protein n=1 Tax=Rhamnusium bicolor TaxID=1586634 RepID=A0AAV8ZUH9_9CUCU|nr:hypothetical protein NQ314_001119 [Rhamnusium bicolor]
MCPFPSEDLTFFPNPDDCSEYWQCYEGNKQLMKCPEHFVWNEELGYCDYSANVDCQGRTPGPDTTISPGSTTTVLTTTPRWSPDPLCPYPSEDIIFYPNPDDCSQYYECFEGSKRLMSCPANYFWNTDTGYCDELQNVDCTKSTINVELTDLILFVDDTSMLNLSQNLIKVNSDDEAQSTSSTEEPATTVTVIPDPLCPYPSDDFIFYPDPTDCSQYYECYQGKKDRLKCPANFFWNTDTNYCDYLQNVDCTKNYQSTTINPATTTVAPITSTTTVPPSISTSTTVTTPTPTTTSTPDTTPVTSTTEVTTTRPTSPGTSLCYRHPDGTFMADPDDCSKYIECNLGQDIIGQCPSGLLWHEAITSCDFPDHVDC